MGGLTLKAARAPASMMRVAAAFVPLAALLGTLANLYQGVPRRWVVADLLFAFNSFPALALQEALREKRADIADLVGARTESAAPQPEPAVPTPAPA